MGNEFPIDQYSNITDSEKEQIDNWPERILTHIMARYPFLTKKEEGQFIEGVQKIETTDQVSAIDQMLALLNNPHAYIEKSKENKPWGIPEMDPGLKPTGVLIENILVMKVPTMSGIKLEDFENAFLPLKDKSEGLIIDLRNNGGGQSYPGYLFADKYLIKPGRRKIDSYRKIAPEGGIEDRYTYSDSPNTPIYNKPIAILVNYGTFSAAEALVSLLKNGSDAVVIGSRTKGGRAGSDIVDIQIDGQYYSLNIPTKRFINPDGTTLEETGIKPDIHYHGTGIVGRAVDIIHSINENNERESIQ